MKHTKTIALFSLYGCTLFLSIVCTLHFLRPDKTILSCFVSEFAVGDYGWLMTIAFYTLALSSALLLISLVQNGKSSSTGIIATGIFCVGILLAGIFPTDVPVEPPTPRGLIHGLAALLALFSLGVAMIAWGNAFRRNERLKSISKLSVFYGIASLVLLLIFVASPVSIRGLTQRILLLWDISWLLLMSWKLYRNTAVTASSTNVNQ